MDQENVSREPHVCTVSLLSGTPIRIPQNAREALVADLMDALGPVVVLKSEDTAMHLVFEDVRATFEGGKKAPANFMLLSDAAPDMTPDPEKSARELEESLSQTWDWPEASETAASASHTLQLFDIMATALDPWERINFYHTVLYTVLRHVPCAAVHFPQSQCVVDPASYLANAPGLEETFPLYGLVNVRFFSVDGAPEDAAFMDTLGLHVFGLPDVQCYVRDIEPGNLAGWLYSVAGYLPEHPDAINEGDTTDGEDGEPWTLHYEYSAVEPRRVVITAHAGEKDAWPEE